MHASAHIRHSVFVILAVVSIAAAAVFIAGCGKGDTQATVTRRDITGYATLKGNIAVPAAADASVLAPYAAPVARVYVTVGQLVKRGEVLFDLSMPGTDAYYQQARTRLQQAQSALAQAKTQYMGAVQTAKQNLAQARTSEVQIRNALKAAQNGATTNVTGDDLDAAIAQRQAAEQAVLDAQATMETNVVPYERDVQNAQQAFQDAQVGKKAASVRAPISGTVLELNIQSGQQVSPDDKKAAARVVDLEALKVYASVDDNVLPLLKPGSPAQVNVNEVAGVTFDGKVNNLYSKEAGFLKGVEHVAVVDFDNSKGQVKPGMDAVVRIQTGQVKNALAVPASAVYQQDNHPVVKVRSGKDWVPRVVDAGISDGSYTEIRSGLKEGDIVLANP